MLASHEKCTGCSACEQSCPVNAITMTTDVEGFLYPVISEKDCISCGICDRTCPITNDKVPMRTFDSLGFAGTLKDKKELQNSTSGGAFYALAKRVIQEGGIVYGAVMDNELHVVHRPATTMEELSSLRKSKYIQSDLGDTFSKIKKNLETGVFVLFSGTPCQCSGLYSYLQKEHANLLMVEVFCAQITSELPYRRYLQYLEAKKHAAVCHVEFREKSGQTEEAKHNLGIISGGWKAPYMHILYDNKEQESIPWMKDRWTIAYSESLLMRPSCAQCKFKQCSGFTCADISIGDFWGVENNAPELFHPAGVSAVLVYSEKGMSWMGKIKNEMMLQAIDKENIMRGNPHVLQSRKANPKRNDFFSALAQTSDDFETLLARFLGIKKYKNKHNLKIGVLGGFNLRKSVIDFCGSYDGTMTFHISNLSLISLMSDEITIPSNMELPKNLIRADMVKLDFEKALFKKEPEKRLLDIDYLVIDFLEERFDIIQYADSYLTYSDAMSDASFNAELLISREDSALESLWESACLEFVSYLTKYHSNQQVILVKSYLSIRYEDDNGKLVEFSKKEFPHSITRLNKILDKYYDFFLKHYPVKHVITIDNSLLYCENHHKHGVLPSHSNTASCWDVTKKISEIIDERETKL